MQSCFLSPFGLCSLCIRLALARAALAPALGRPCRDSTGSVSMKGHTHLCKAEDKNTLLTKCPQEAGTVKDMRAYTRLLCSLKATFWPNLASIHASCQHGDTHTQCSFNALYQDHALPIQAM